VEKQSNGPSEFTDSNVNVNQVVGVTGGN